MQLEGTPLGLQPTDSIRVAWMGKTIGAVSRVDTAAVHDGQILAFRLEWDDPTENRQPGDNTDFPDAAAVLFPSAPNAPLVTMGAPGLAVNAWYWRADSDTQTRQVLAEGIGTSRTVAVESGQASASWKEGRWRVVIARALRVQSADPLAQLQPGESTGFALAIWDGAHGERGGIKAYTGPQWQSLQLDAPKTARS
jgi:DMSO reductase family type II enzyme heme b subunit